MTNQGERMCFISIYQTTRTWHNALLQTHFNCASKDYMLLAKAQRELNQYCHDKDLMPRQICKHI